MTQELTTPRGVLGDLHAARTGGAAELYLRERERIRRVCRYIVGDDNDVEDLVHETFVRAAPHLRRIDRDAGRYLIAVARNLCRDELRRRGRVQVGSVPHADVQPVEERVLDRRALECIWNELSWRDRTALTYVADGLSHEEIAGLLGTSQNAVAQMVSRARRRARMGLERLSLQWPPPVVPHLIGRVRTAVTAPVRRPAWLSRLQDSSGLMAPVIVSVAAALAAPNPIAPAPATALRSGLAGSSVRPSGGPSPILRQPVSLSAGPVQASSSGTWGISPGSSGSPPGASAPSGPPSAPVIGPGLVQPDASSDAFNVDGFAAAPDYSSDRAVFASGIAVHGCSDPTSCPVLWRSGDGGVSWTLVSLAGWQRCTPVPSPAFARDHVVLGYCGAVGGAVRSDDGGATFTTLLPTSTVDIVADPTSAAGDPRVVVVSAGAILDYDIASRVWTPGPQLPDGATPHVIAVDAGSGDVFAAGTSAAGEALYRCHGALPCAQVAALPWQPTHIVLSPAFASDGTLVVRHGEQALVSHDGGTTLVPLIAGVLVEHVQFTGAGVVLAVVRAAGGVYRLAESRDDARTFTVAADTQLPLAAYLVLPDGRLLAGLRGADLDSQAGIRCSTDGARTWRYSC